MEAYNQFTNQMHNIWHLEVFRSIERVNNIVSLTFTSKDTAILIVKRRSLSTNELEEREFELTCYESPKDDQAGSYVFHKYDSHVGVLVKIYTQSTKVEN